MGRKINITASFILAGALLLGISLPAAASYLPFNTNVNMNVGIGTTIPQGALTVMNGNVGIGTWKPSTALEVNGGAVGAFGLGSVDIAPAVFSSTSLAGGHTNYIVINNNDGGGNISNGIAFDSVKTELWSVVNDYANNGSQNLSILDIPVSSGTPVILIDALGNLGIGTVTPGQKLDIKGTARMTGLTLTGNGAGNGNVLVGNSVGVGTWMPASTLGVSGSVTNYWLKTAGVGNVGISTANTVGIGTSSGVGAGLVVMNGNVGIGTWAPLAPLQIVGIGTQSINGGGLIVTKGNVGIGTSWPGYLLDVENYNLTGTAINGTSSSFSQNDAGVIGNNTSSGVGVIGTSSSGIGVVAVNTSSEPALVASSFNGGPAAVFGEGNVGIGTTSPQGALTVMNGNVGIGTWAPSYLLDLNLGTLGIVGLESTPGNNPGTIQSSFGNFLFTSNAYFDGSDWRYIGNGAVSQFQAEGTSGNAYILTAPPGTAGSIANVLDRLTVANAGNVGIGTYIPQGALDVRAGQTAVSGVANGAQYVQTLTASNNNDTLTALHIEPTFTNGAYTNVTNNGLVVESGTVLVGTPSVVNGGDKQMQVYTNTLGQGLEIRNETTNGDWTYALNATASGAGNTNNVAFYTWASGATNNYGLYVESGNVYVAGSVGIGVITPGQALDIQGTARMTGFTLTGNGAANGNVLVGNSVGVGTWMPVSTLGVSGGGGTNYWLNNSGGNVGISTIYAVGIGTAFVGGTHEGALTVMNGNVGIGTWLPQSSLAVMNGNVGIGTLGASYPLEVVNSNGLPAIFAYNTTGFGYGVEAISDTGVGLDAISNGASGADYALMARQYGGGSAAYFLGGSTATTPTVIIQQATGGSADLLQAQNTGGTSLVNITSTGNVGIGTWIPTSMLQVAGNVGVGTSAIGSTPRELNINNVALFNSEYNNGSPSSPITINWANGNKQAVKLTAAGMTINFTNPPAGVGALQLKVIQDGTGSRTVTTWTPSSGNIYWSGGSAPTLTSTPNYLDIVSCYYDGTNYYCAATMNFQ